jgi:hypothetical protein
MSDLAGKNGISVAGLNAARVRRRQTAKVTVIPIRANSGLGAKEPANRPIEITCDSSSAAIFKRIEELRFELRCVEEVILTLEILAVSRFPARLEQLPTWKVLPSANRQ